MHLHGFLFLLLSFTSAHAFFGYVLMRCQFTSNTDYLYLEQLFIDKLLLGQFNSSVGKYVGFTEKAKKLVEILNKDKGFMEQEKENEAKCKDHLSLMTDFVSKSVEPTVRVKSVKAASSDKPGIISCSAYNFYPKNIRLTWLIDGKEVTSDVTSSGELPNGNWFYQIHSELEYTPAAGEKISCMVEHASLASPKIYDWDPVVESDSFAIAVGTVVLVIGLVLLLAGLIVYKRAGNGRELVSTSFKETASKAEM
ncbi:DLA class II histocompatibility antigen, DR-1 beta chain-like [Mugil cephalus]|uniref:DLA class II histocompatibility antigen, DR-1 beta chain-like n=1 Tax=Mugil cephalus TaxID=48193 RepID=UPI001FB7CB10|nr:DLA class II histocompatibility antigen, DR-1 beta chain-like [Mugil cephalus]